MTYQFQPQGVCPMMITFDLDNNVVRNVSFMGGCDGNLKAISKIVDGMTADQITEAFNGIKCGRKQTSCTDQLSIAVAEALKSAEQA